MKKYKVNNRQVPVGFTYIRIYFPTHAIESSHLERYLSLVYREDIKFIDGVLNICTRDLRNK